MACIAVAVSGGIDSLCSLLTLKKSGHDVFAIHGLFKPDAITPPGLSDICARAGIEFLTVDLRSVFATEVIAYFDNSQAAGLTPNPCAMCNRQIKFGALMDSAMAMGADFLATGHYARLENPGFLYPAADMGKDQAYFLSLVPQIRLRSAIFPLYAQTKNQTKAIVAELGYQAPLPKESQDVCFLERGVATTKTGPPGPVLLRKPGQEAAPIQELEQIGRHKGCMGLTVGQRKGLSIPWREPLYIQARSGNSLIVAPAALLNMYACSVNQINYFLPIAHWPGIVYARFRYRQKLCPVSVEPRGDALMLKLLEPRRVTAPGQIVAVYDAAGRILAGGITQKVEMY